MVWVESERTPRREHAGKRLLSIYHRDQHGQAGDPSEAQHSIRTELERKRRGWSDLVVAHTQPVLEGSDQTDHSAKGHDPAGLDQESAEEAQNQ